jgi:hypothetical protein
MIRHVSLACWVVVMAAVASAELTDEQMKSLGATQEQIDAFRAGDVEPPTLTASDYLAGGRSAEGRLTRAIASGADGLALARDVLHRDELRNVSWPDYAVLNGLSEQTSEDVLDVLEEAVAQHGPKSALWRPTRKAWAAAFRRLHGDSGFELARQRVENTALTPRERALHLLVFQYARWEDDYHSMAIEVYRPYLHVSAPELQQAAVSVAWDLWDYEAWGEIEEVAWTSPDWKARSLANGLITSFYMLGPDPRARPMNRHGRVQGGCYDPAGLSEWRSRRREWDRERLEREASERPVPLPVSPDSPSGAPRARGAP